MHMLPYRTIMHRASLATCLPVLACHFCLLPFLPAAVSSALPSPAMPLLGLPPDVDMSVGKKGSGHRRHRSLTAMLLPGWRRRGKTSGEAGWSFS